MSSIFCSHEIKAQRSFAIVARKSEVKLKINLLMIATTTTQIVLNPTIILLLNGRDDHFSWQLFKRLVASVNRKHIVTNQIFCGYLQLQRA